MDVRGRSREGTVRFTVVSGLACLHVLRENCFRNTRASSHQNTPQLGNHMVWGTQRHHPGHWMSTIKEKLTESHLKSAGRLPFGLVSRKCYPAWNQAVFLFLVLLSGCHRATTPENRSSAGDYFLGNQSTIVGSTRNGLGDLKLNSPLGFLNRIVPSRTLTIMSL